MSLFSIVIHVCLDFSFRSWIKGIIPVVRYELPYLITAFNSAFNYCLKFSCLTILLKIWYHWLLFLFKNIHLPDSKAHLSYSIRLQLLTEMTFLHISIKRCFCPMSYLLCCFFHSLKYFRLFFISLLGTHLLFLK